MAVASRVIPLPVPRGTHGLSDRLLVARVASGDDQAFEEILDRYGPALLSFCVHMLGSCEWGEDALQLTFVAAYKALRRGQCDGELRPWLYAIARNRCLSELRARREIPDSDRVSAERPAIDDPASLFARREQLREVVEDIQRLPADQRAALVLFELGDHSHEEIATVLGVRRDKVKALIFQAREGLYRGRSARERACSDVRELLANARGNAPARGLVRAHVDRCAPCQAFEREVRRQRAALALVLPVALSGRLKALVLSSTLGHGSVAAGAAGVTGAGGAGSVAGATAAGAGSGVVAGSGSLGAGAAATATGSASTTVIGAAGAAAGSGGVSAAAGTAAPTIVASALGTGAVAGVGALTSSISAGTVAKLATVVAVAVGVGGVTRSGVTRSALTPSPRPQVSLLAGQPAQPAPLRSPLQPLGSGIVAPPLATAAQPGPQPAAGAAPPGGAPPTAGRAAAPSSAANPAAVNAPSTPGAGGPSSPIGTASAPTASAPTASTPGDGSATTTAPSSGSSTTTAATTTTTASSPTGSGTSTSTTTTASSPTTTSTGTSDASSGASGNGSGNSTGQGQPSGGNPGAGVTQSN